MGTLILAKKKLACGEVFVVEMIEIGCDSSCYECSTDFPDGVSVSVSDNGNTFVKPQKDLRNIGNTLLKAADRYDAWLGKQKAKKKGKKR